MVGSILLRRLTLEEEELAPLLLPPPAEEEREPEWNYHDCKAEAHLACADFFLRTAEALSDVLARKREELRFTAEQFVAFRHSRKSLKRYLKSLKCRISEYKEKANAALQQAVAEQLLADPPDGDDDN